MADGFHMSGLPWPRGMRSMTPCAARSSGARRVDLLGWWTARAMVFVVNTCSERASAPQRSRGMESRGTRVATCHADSPPRPSSPHARRSA